MTVPLGAYSEVGRLRRVLVHRPGLEHTRLTPSNAEELLFDDVIRVARAKSEHDTFVEVMRDRGVEVFDAEQLLAEALVKPETKDWVSDHVLNERQVGITASRRARELVETADPAVLADFLIGGMTRADINQDMGLMWKSADPTTMLLPPLPNFIFQRDPSCWIFGGVTINPMTKPARVPETMIMDAIYKFHPMFTAEDFPVWLGGVDEDWGRCHVEGGDVMPIGNGTVMIGMGERTSPQAVVWIARSLFRADAAQQVLAVHLPKSRSYMHLDTVITMCDRDLVTLFPQVVYGAHLGDPTRGLAGAAGERGTAWHAARADGQSARGREDAGH
jgi:arginine deiminase